MPRIYIPLRTSRVRTRAALRGGAMGKAMSWGEKQLYVGIEYDYWKDKYGIDNDSFLGDEILQGTDQNTASLLVKVHY